MAVSRATRELLDRYGSDPAAVAWWWESTAVGVVVRHGSRSDAEALLPVFLADPEARRDLVPVFARHGDAGTAERLLEACVDKGRLREDAPEDVLHAVGYLGYEPAEQLLWEHVEGSHHVSKAACLGLANLSCRGLRTRIAESLERHLGANLFPEFLPVLAAKTGDPSWLGRLVEWGESGASTDCNGGLILGVALHGEAGRAEFTRLLWNPRWEADDSATGSRLWTYAGTRVLGIQMADLYADLLTRLRSGTESENRHCLDAFTAMLECWGGRTWLGLRGVPDPRESHEALHDLLFTWSTPHEDDSLTHLAIRTLGHEDRTVTALYHLEANLRSEVLHELELRETASR